MKIALTFCASLIIVYGDGDDLIRDGGRENLRPVDTANIYCDSVCRKVLKSLYVQLYMANFKPLRPSQFRVQQQNKHHPPPQKQKRLFENELQYPATSHYMLLFCSYLVL